MTAHQQLMLLRHLHRAKEHYEMMLKKIPFNWQFEYIYKDELTNVNEMIELVKGMKTED